MEILITVLTFVVILFGTVGVFLPMVPGPLVVWLALLGCNLAWPGSPAPVGIPTLIFGLVLVAVAKAVDLLAGIWGARKFGASWAGAWGALIGGLVFTLLGLFLGFGVILAAIIGPALGAFIAEWAFGKTWREALRAGWGTFVGYVTSIAFNLMVCGLLLAIFAVECLVHVLR